VLALAGCAGPGGADDPEPLSSWVEPVTGMEFLWVPPGRFRMGSPPTVAGRQADETLHEVELTRGYFMGRYEVTQEEWMTVMGENPSHFAECGPRCPVETVSYVAVEDFIARLEALSLGNRFRLPTEAEWERACRAGTETPFSTGANLTAEQADVDGRYPYPPAGAADPIDSAGPKEGDGRFVGSPTPVGSYPPNPWGFYDLHGNVWEWCQDWYAPYADDPAAAPGALTASGAVRDPRGPRLPSVHAPAGLPGFLRVIRGGSWAFDVNSARCGLRYTHRPQDDGFSLGFRLVRVLADR